MFNNFFSNIGTEMVNKIPQTNSNIFLKPVNNNGILLLISKSKNNCASGSDQLQVKTIKSIHT